MTALLILSVPILVAWGYINQKRAEQNLADRDRLNAAPKDAINQFYNQNQ